MMALMFAIHRRRVPGLPAWGAGIAAAVAAAAVISGRLDTATFAETWRSMRGAPWIVLAVLLVYGAAFVIRALVWTRVLPALRFGHALAAIHLALLANHLLPMRLGEALRVASVVRRQRIPVGPAAASTLTLRAGDLLALAALLCAFGAPIAAPLMDGSLGILLVCLATVIVAGTYWLVRLRGAYRGSIRLPGLAAISGSLAAWLVEAVVVWQVSGWAGVQLDAEEAVLVTCASILAQVVAIAPGGFGTYEAAASGMLVTLGTPLGSALTIALITHALKTAYSFMTGAVAAFLPAPGLFGRFRLAPGPAFRRAEHLLELGKDHPVVLFFPARNEERSVGHVIGRAPAEVLGHRVECIVVDDASEDSTRAEALRAGATVISLDRWQGLGAAVRRGLAEGVARGAAAVVFCDADGEYDPHELERLVAPILSGDADYVVGSRFGGEPRRMLPHRLVGNLILTRALSFVARRRLSDGQSGYRALSYGAASRAEIVHDFNYAQVLTLDLLAKGFRYEEVPISYRFRTSGRSFVRLLPYLKTVMPAIYREVNGLGRRGVRPLDPALSGGARSILDDVGLEAAPRLRPGRLVESSVAPQGVCSRPRHGEGVVGVVVGEEALAAERHDPRLGRPTLQPPQRVPVAAEVDGVRVSDPLHLARDRPGGRQSRLG